MKMNHKDVLNRSNPVMPVMVIENIEQALPLAEALYKGGIDVFELSMLKALGDPFPEVTFCPTGGINPVNYQSFLTLPNVACVGGSWIAPAKLVRESKWDEITALAKEVTGK